MAERLKAAVPKTEGRKLRGFKSYRLRQTLGRSSSYWQSAPLAPGRFWVQVPAGPPVMNFEEFAKIPRLSRECVITEKIDGTNGQILITDDLEVLSGSRSQWITPANDSFGFARWVYENAEQLRAELGIGRHYGEWWGAGVGRRYGMTAKVFSLFNTHRWKDAPLTLCRVVPVLYEGPFTTEAVERALDLLRREGSLAAPGFMKPEGVVVFHKAANSMFKKTLEKDEEWKGKAPVAPTVEQPLRKETVGSSSLSGGSTP